MEVFENLVMRYLTQGGSVFVVPQYSISIAEQGDWACPDFLALDFKIKEVVVVEVTTAFRFASLISRVAERESRWFQPVRAKLQTDGLADQALWPMRFVGFVRRDTLHAASAPFNGQLDVAFKAIEDIAFPWDYWLERAAKGLHR